MKRILIVLVLLLFLLGCGGLGANKNYQEAQESVPDDLQNMIEFQDPENIPTDFDYNYAIYPNSNVESFVKIDSAELPNNYPQGTMSSFVSYTLQLDTKDDLIAIKQYYDEIFTDKGWNIQNDWLIQDYNTNSYDNGLGWQEPGFVTISVILSEGKFKNDISLAIMEY